MIELINGHVQDVGGNPIVPNGYIELYLSDDAQVIASPYGQVLGGTTNAILFGFDSNADIVEPAYIWSNAELNPQQDTSPPTYGTYYVVNFYDENGTRLNNRPMQWVFTQPNGSTVDIGDMIPVSIGGGTYYPAPLIVVPEHANYVYAGPPSGSPDLPTFRPLVPADLPVATTSALGAVKPDGTTITVNDGVISTASFYDVGTFITQQYTASQVFVLVQLERAVNFAANMAPSTAVCGVNPTGTTVFSVQKNSSQFATITFNTNGTTAFSGSATSFAQGDLLSIVGASEADATLANVGIILSGVL